MSVMMVSKSFEDHKVPEFDLELWSVGVRSIESGDLDLGCFTARSTVVV